MKKAIILRGLPGSGKSTLARTLVTKNNNAVVHSTDAFFMTPEGYKFDSSKLAQYHKANLENFKKSLELGIELIICDNTNTRLWEFAEYAKAARDNEYEVEFKTIGDPKDLEHQKLCAERNKHGVSLETIQKMAERFEFP